MFLKSIIESYNKSIQEQNTKYVSRHWKLNNIKKKKLFKIKNLPKFRVNGLANGLGGGFSSREKLLSEFEKLKKELGYQKLLSNLTSKNIGSYNNIIKVGKKYVDGNQLCHIKWLNDLEKDINLKSLKVICEIGAGYGCFAEKFLRNTKSKYIIIDLPEANFLSSYFLYKNLPNKKILLSNKINNSISSKEIKKYDIIIMNPWHKILNIKVDLFINARSMMEMDYFVIKKYFDLIHKNLKTNGYFLNINRYVKSTIGYPVEFSKYPYNKRWKVIKSNASWNQNHIHLLLTKKIKSSGDIQSELKKINFIKIRKSFKIDKYLIKSILPSFLFIFLQKLKNNLIK